MNQWLNQRLGRTEFTPFAPATLRASPRLLRRCGRGRIRRAVHDDYVQCIYEMRQTSPAAVHVVTGQLLVQLVTETSNPGFYAILTEYYRLTGIPR